MKLSYLFTENENDWRGLERQLQTEPYNKILWLQFFRAAQRAGRKIITGSLPDHREEITGIEIKDWPGFNSELTKSEPTITGLQTAGSGIFSIRHDGLELVKNLTVE